MGATLYQKWYAFESQNLPRNKPQFLETIKHRFPTVQSGLNMYLYESEAFWKCILADMTQSGKHGIIQRIPRNLFKSAMSDSNPVPMLHELFEMI